MTGVWPFLQAGSHVQHRNAGHGTESDDDVPMFYVNRLRCLRPSSVRVRDAHLLLHYQAS